MKNKIFCTVLLIIIQCLIYSVFAQNISSQYSVPVDSAFMSTAKITVKIKGDFSLSKEQNSGNTIKMVFKSKTDLLNVKTFNSVDDSSARKIVRDKRFLVENLYKTQPSPYPDVVSNTVNCPDRFRPLTIEAADSGKWIFAYKIFANERFVFGECSDDAIFYTCAYIFIYCRKNKILNEIKYFTPGLSPVNKAEDVIGGVECVE